MSWFASTEGPDLTRVSAAEQTVRTDLGRSVNLADIEYDADTNTFSYYGSPVTTLSRAQRLAFPSYDVERDNASISDAKRGGTPTGSASVIANFFDGVGSDIAAVAQGTRDFVAGKDGQTSDLRKVVYVVVAFAFGYLIWKIVVAVKAK